MIQLCLRLGLPPREVESWDFETIREFIAVLTEDKRRGSQSAEQLERGLMQAFGKKETN